MAVDLHAFPFQEKKIYANSKINCWLIICCSTNTQISIFLKYDMIRLDKKYLIVSITQFGNIIPCSFLIFPDFPDYAHGYLPEVENLTFCN